MLKRGFFVEDTFGQLMLNHLQTLHKKEVGGSSSSMRSSILSFRSNTTPPTARPINQGRRPSLGPAASLLPAPHAPSPPIPSPPIPLKQGLAAANATHAWRYGAYMLVVPSCPDSDDEDTPARRGRVLTQQRQNTIYDAAPGEGEEAGAVAAGAEEEVVAHLDGRDFLTRAQMRAKGLEPWIRKVGVCTWVWIGRDRLARPPTCFRVCLISIPLDVDGCNGVTNNRGRSSSSRGASGGPRRTRGWRRTGV